jgi:hypothetical protein
MRLVLGALALILASDVAAEASPAPAPGSPARSAAPPAASSRLKSDLSFCQPPFVSPLIIKDLLAWLSDGGDQVVAINLTDSNGSNRYSGDIETSASKLPHKHPAVSVTTKSGEGEGEHRETVGYEYIGLTSSGVHVLTTWEYGGGTMVARALLFVVVEEDHAIVQVPAAEGAGIGNRNASLRLNHPRLVLRKLGELALGDRWEGELRVEGNKIYVGKDQGHFSGMAGDEPPIYNAKNVVLQLEDGAVRPGFLKPCP